MWVLARYYTATLECSRNCSQGLLETALKPTAYFQTRYFRCEHLNIGHSCMGLVNLLIIGTMMIAFSHPVYSLRRKLRRLSLCPEDSKCPRRHHKGLPGDCVGFSERQHRKIKSTTLQSGMRPGHVYRQLKKLHYRLSHQRFLSHCSTKALCPGQA